MFDSWVRLQELGDSLAGGVVPLHAQFERLCAEIDFHPAGAAAARGAAVAGDGASAD